MERLSGEYNRGYRQAIMDMQEVFGYVDYDLKHHKKKLTMPLAKELLQCVLMNREAIREKRNVFIRWNCVSNQFECVKPKR